MVLRELPIFKTLLAKERERKVKCYPGRIPLENLEVVQLYHSTSISNRDSILTYGLVAFSRIETWRSYAPRVFASTTLKDLPFFEDSADIWTFYMPKSKLIPDDMQSSGNHYYIEETVPWHKLYLHETILKVNEWQFELYNYND